MILQNRRQPAHEMFVQSDVTGSLEVERAIIILMKNLRFSHRALFAGKPRTTEGICRRKPMRAPREPRLPVNHKCVVVLFGKVEKCFAGKKKNKKKKGRGRERVRVAKHICP